MKKVKFLRVPSGAKVRGIFSGASGGGYVVTGDACNPNEGGGSIGEITFDNGFITFRKVDAEGKPCRDYGAVKTKGDKLHNIVGDGVAVSAEGYVIVFDDDESSQEMPTARPIPASKRV